MAEDETMIITVLLAAAADILGALVPPQGGAAEAPPERAHHVHLRLFLEDHKCKKIHFIYSSNPLGSFTRDARTIAQQQHS